MAAVKPTVTEYDLSFGGLVQYDERYYALVREWILEGGSSGGGTVIDTTFADFLVLYQGGTLVPGSSYQITDFATTQDIPNTVDSVTGGIEPLIVYATSTSGISPIVLSADQPTDVLTWDPEDTDFGALTGRITFRKNTARNVEAPFDYRVGDFRRWETSAGSGVFTVVSDNGEAFIDQKLFDDADADNCTQIGTPGVLPNNVAAGPQDGIFFGFGTTENTVGQDCINIRMESQCTLNTVGDTSGQISLAPGCNGNAFGLGCQDMELDSNCDGNNFGDGCDTFRFGLGCSNNDFGGSSIGIYFEYFNSNIDASGGAVASFNFKNSNDSIQFGGAAAGIKIGSGNIDLIFGTNAVSITIGDANLFNDMSGATMSNVTIGNSVDFLSMVDPNNVNIIIGDGCGSCTIQGNSSYITIGSNSSVININTANQYVEIGSDSDNCSTNTLCTRIKIGNGCSAANIGANNSNIQFFDGVQSRSTSADEQDRQDWPNRSFMNVIYDFANNGGAIGTITLATLGAGANLVNSTFRQVTPFTTAGPNADLSMGIQIDDPVILFDAILDTDAMFDGTTGRADITIGPPTWSVRTTVPRFIQFIIATEPLTAGVFECQLEVFYS